jgi:hypothetical protein
MKQRFIVKNLDKLWPTVLWQGTSIVTYFIDDMTEDVKIRKSKGIDFDELLTHIDRGGSIFLTNQQKDTPILDEYGEIATTDGKKQEIAGDIIE